MRKKILAMAVAGLAVPALALAAQPRLIRVDGHNVPLREVVQVVHTAAGPVRVRTWSWRGPDGATTIQVSESRGASPVMPSWAVEQMRALQAQMRQMRLIEAAFAQPPPSFPLRVMFGQPVLVPMQAPPVEVRFLEPVIPLRVVPLPAHVIVVLPQAPLRHAAPTTHHRGKIV